MSIVKLCPQCKTYSVIDKKTRESYYPPTHSVCTHCDWRVPWIAKLEERDIYDITDRHNYFTCASD